MKSVLISIRPEWCEKIAIGEKTIEIRKTRPKLETPFKCYIYCTIPTKFYAYATNLYTSQEYLHLCDGKVTMNDGFEFFGREDYFTLNRKVIGEFICDKIDDIYEPYLTWLEEASCVDMEKIANYKGEQDIIYGWHISDLKIYDKPRELSEFSKIYKRDKEGIVKCDHEPCDFIDENGRYIYHDCVNECPHFADKYTIKRPPQSWQYIEGGAGWND